MLRKVLDHFGFDFTKREVNIGLCNNMDREQRHGIIHLQAVDGTEMTCGFLADKPHHLENPSLSTVQQLFDQVEKMFMVATGVEIMVGGTLQAYRRLDGGKLKLVRRASLH